MCYDTITKNDNRLSIKKEKERKMKRSKVFVALGLTAVLTVGCSSTKTSSSENPSPSVSEESLPEKTEETAASSETDEVYTIRVGISEAMDNPLGQTAQNIADEVNEKSNGRIQMQIFPSSQLGGPGEMLEAVGFGNLEMTICTPTDLVSFVPQYGVLTFPYLFADKETAYEVLDGEIGQELSGYAEKVGFKVLGYPEIGFRQITNNVRPITKLEDFSGIKIRTRGVNAHLETFKAFGANPVSVDFSELYSALQQKVVDGQENSTTNIYYNNFFEVQKYLSVTNTFYEAWAITMNNDNYNALPDDLKEILETAIANGVKENRETISAENDRYLEELRGLMEVNEIEESEMDRIIDAAHALYPEFSDEIGQELVQRVLKYVEN